MPRTRSPASPWRAGRLAVAACAVVASSLGVSPLGVTAVGPVSFGAIGAAHADPGAGGTGASSLPDPEAYRALATQLFRDQRAAADLLPQIDQAEARLTQTEHDLADVQQRLDDARAALDALKTTVRERAAFIYSHARTATMAVTDIQKVVDVAAGRQYAEAATTHDVDHIAELTQAADALDAKRAALVDTRNAQQDDSDRLHAEKDDLDARIARQKDALDRAGAITVMGDPVLTGAQMSEWFASRGARYHLMGDMTITELADIYVEEGAAEHVRPELAFVQAMVETGSFANATDNNFAGIGACDSCSGEIPFPTPRDGVRGQIQLLRNYADPSSRAATLANPPSAPIYGNDPVHAANAYDTFFAKGVAPTWNLMGAGNWATDPEYAPKVLTLYFQLMAFASTRP